MALPTLLDHEMVAGDADTIQFQVVDEDGTTPLDITGWSLSYRAVYSEESDAEVVISKSIPAGDIVITSASTGEGYVVLSPSDTSGFGEREFPHMLETTDLAGDRKVTAAGALSLSGRLPS